MASWETRPEETTVTAVCTSGPPAAEEMDDKSAIKDVSHAISLCLDNYFKEAEELLKPWSVHLNHNDYNFMIRVGA
jgi:hypothetical protein